MRVLTLLVAALLTLTGCTQDQSSPSSTVVASIGIDQIRVTDGETDKPVVTLPTPLTVTETQRRVLTEGKGGKAAEGQRVTIDYVGVNGTDGEEFNTTYGQRPTSFILNGEYNLKGLVSGLIGTPVGSRVLIAVPPGEGFGLEGLPAAGIGPTDTIVLVVDLKDARAVLTRATGTAVKAKAGLPTVKLDGKGKPTITVPKSAAPTGLVVQSLITGKGAKVARGQRITVNYLGVIWPGGKQFDSSWGRASPATFTIGTGRVIGGWDRGLVGQPIGSQVLLVIPPDDGYGAEGKPDAGIRGTDTLVFVVDILDAA
jgi:peptidylprolyl isomerase